MTDMTDEDKDDAGVTLTHEEKNTFSVDVFIPGHDPRVTTALFSSTRLHLLARDGGRCWVCNCTAAEVGHPLEAHHYPIERSFANMIDWGPGSAIRKDFPHFAWGSFELDGKTETIPAFTDEFGVTYPECQQFIPANPYMFVDDMNVNGRLLCKPHHIGKDEGVHGLPEPVWLAQKYGRDGYKFSTIEIIHHNDKPTEVAAI